MRPVAFDILRPIRAHAPLSRATLLRPRCTRLQSQVVYRADGQPIRRQDVQFKKPPMFTWRGILTICLYGSSVYLALKYVPRLAGFDVAVEFVDDDQDEKTADAVQEQAKEGVELTEEDLEAAEDSLFIPMTWAQKLPKTFYKGTDPEWQEFIKVANDKERQNTICAELVGLFRKTVVKYPMWNHALGGDVKPAKHWLDLHFPDGPPEEFMRQGLEFGDGYIAWSKQRIQNEKQFRILRALWPRAAFDSAWALCKTVVILQWEYASHALGLNTNESSFEKKLKAAAAAMNKSRERVGLPKAQTDPDDAASAGTSSSAVSRKDENSDRAQKALWPLPPVRSPWSNDPEAQNERKLRAAIVQHTFGRTLAQRWNQKKAPIPRGAFAVDGIVELHGKNGRIGADVRGVYDPKQSKFITFEARMRYFKRWKQTPRGGN